MRAVWQLLCWSQAVLAARQEVMAASKEEVGPEVVPPFHFSEDWQVLGPFQIGTRGRAKPTQARCTPLMTTRGTMGF